MGGRDGPAFDALYGLEVDAATAEEARGRVAGRRRRQAARRASSTAAIYASMAESLAVAGHRRARDAAARSRSAHSSQTSFLRPILEGTVHAAGRPRHRGRTTWVWEFDITDDAGRLCALVRMTVGVRAAAA